MFSCNGSIHVNKPVSPELEHFLFDFCRTKHVKKNNAKIQAHFPDWQHQCFKGNLGKDGAYFIGDLFTSLDMNPTVISKVLPAQGVPSMYCPWFLYHNDFICVADDKWTRADLVKEVYDWLKYLIKHFLKEDGYILNGTVNFLEDNGTSSKIHVVNNDIKLIVGIPSLKRPSYTDDELLQECLNRGLLDKRDNVFYWNEIDKILYSAISHVAALSTIPIQPETLDEQLVDTGAKLRDSLIADLESVGGCFPYLNEDF